MKKTPIGKILLVLSICCLFCFFSFGSQTSQRFFDDAPRKSDDVRLIVLNPTKNNIQTLAELRERDLITIQNLTVIGLFHEKQLQDRIVARSYEEAAKFAEESGRDWLRFHRLEKSLDPGTLFHDKALRDELFKIFSLSDGLLLFGGADIPPALYGKKTSLLTDISTPYRSYIETAVAFHLLGGWQDEKFISFCESHPQYPILGLCLGCQSLNVGTGGTLFQDIPSEIYGKTNIEAITAMGRENWHQNPYAMLFPQDFRSSNMHQIKLEADGKFTEDWGFKRDEKPFVYSAHHQAIKKRGKGIRVIATSLDGKVVEAIEHEVYPHVLGVQFHPEARSLWDTTKKSRLTPDEEEKADLYSILEGNPPSLDFHKKLWSWFSQKLESFWRLRNEQKVDSTDNEASEAP